MSVMRQLLGEVGAMLRIAQWRMTEHPPYHVFPCRITKETGVNSGTKQESLLL
jgi:hypothetical protein